MSELTARLVGGRGGRSLSRAWRDRFVVIADRLVATYGVPRLGNYRDPIREIFYIQ